MTWVIRVVEILTIAAIVAYFSIGAYAQIVLSKFGGLYTEADPRDLPAGASPLCWDIDFQIAGIGVRPGQTNPAPSFSPSPTPVMYVKSAQLFSASVTETSTNLTLAEDDGTTIYAENLDTPGTFNSVYTPILNTARALSETVSQREYICLSNFVQGTDQPRQYDGANFDRISQVGPGSGPLVTVSSPSYGIVQISEIYQPNYQIAAIAWGAALTITGFPGAGSNLYFVSATGYTSTPFTDLSPGVIIYINGGNSANGTPGAGKNLGGSDPSGTYTVAALGSFSDKNGLHYYFQVVANSQNSNWIGSFSSASVTGVTYQRTPALVQLSVPLPQQNAVVGGDIVISGASIPQWNSTWKITATPTEGQLTIFSISLTSNVASYQYVLQSGNGPAWQPENNYSAGAQIVDSSGDVWQVTYPGVSGGTVPSFSAGTLALTAATAQGNGQTVYIGTVPAGTNYVGVFFTVTGFANAGNNVVGGYCTAFTPGSGTGTLTLNNPDGQAESPETGATASAAASSISDPQSGSPSPAVIWTLQTGVTVFATVFNTTNGSGIFNVQNVPVVACPDPTHFQVAITSANIAVAVEDGSAVVGSGINFIIDPGTTTLGTGNPGVDPIFNAPGVNSMGGNVLVTNTAIGAGQRWAVLMFLTRNGFITPASPPTTFYTTADTGTINFLNIAVGPPDVIARIVAITLANASAAGPYFWVPTEVIVAGSAESLGASQAFGSTVLSDNVSTSFPSSISISDAVLAVSQNISVTGNNLQQERELGECVKVVQWAGRCFYLGERTKNDQFQNLTFDGGLIGAIAATDTLIIGGTIHNGDTVTIGGVVYTLQDVAHFDNTVANNVLIQGPSFPIQGEETMVSLAAAVNANGVYSGYLYSAPTVPNPFVSAANLALGLYVTARLTGTAGNSIGVASSNGSNLWNHSTLVGGSAAGYPTGWTIDPGLKPYVSIISSPPFEQLLYIYNTIGSGQYLNGNPTALSSIISLSQGAYQTAELLQPIIQPNTLYAVRVIASSNEADINASLRVELYSPSLASNWVFSIPLNTMGANLKEFIGTLGNPLWDAVPSDLVLRVYPYNLAYTESITVYRIEIFPQQQPIYANRVAVSYAENTEAIDALTGIVDTSLLSSDPQTNHYVFLNKYYVDTKSRTFTVIQSTGTEPAEWDVDEISNAVGSVGPLASDVGEEYMVKASDDGVYVFNGGDHQKVSQEIQKIWDAIYQPSKNTIWVFNDLRNQRFLIGVPMPTPNQWLPNAGANATPATPNVILCCSYLGLTTGAEIAAGHAVFPSAFTGHLLFHDVKRKWTIWQIPATMAALISRPGNITQLWFGGATTLSYLNGIVDFGSNIAALYTTYGFAESDDRDRLHLSQGRLLFTYALVLAQGGGAITITLLPENSALPSPYPYTQPPFLLQAQATDDLNGPFNMCGANRMFVQIASSPKTYTLTSATYLGGGNTSYAGTFPNLPVGYFVGQYFNVSGFSDSGNNVTAALCTGSAPTYIILANANGVTQAHAGTMVPVNNWSLSRIAMAVGDDERISVTGQ